MSEGVLAPVSWVESVIGWKKRKGEGVKFSRGGNKGNAGEVWLSVLPRLLSSSFSSTYCCFFLRCATPVQHRFRHSTKCDDLREMFCPVEQSGLSSCSIRRVQSSVCLGLMKTPFIRSRRLGTPELFLASMLRTSDIARLTSRT